MGGQVIQLPHMRVCLWANNNNNNFYFKHLYCTLPGPGCFTQMSPRLPCEATGSKVSYSILLVFCFFMYKSIHFKNPIKQQFLGSEACNLIRVLAEHWCSNSFQWDWAEFMLSAVAAFVFNTCSEYMAKQWWTQMIGAAAATRWRTLLKRGLLWERYVYLLASMIE